MYVFSHLCNFKALSRSFSSVWFCLFGCFVVKWKGLTLFVATGIEPMHVSYHWATLKTIDESLSILDSNFLSKRRITKSLLPWAIFASLDAVPIKVFHFEKVWFIPFPFWVLHPHWWHLCQELLSPSAAIWTCSRSSLHFVSISGSSMRRALATPVGFWFLAPRRKGSHLSME